MSDENKKEQAADQEILNQNPDNSTDQKETATPESDQPSAEAPDEDTPQVEDNPPIDSAESTAEESETTEDSSDNTEEETNEDSTEVAEEETKETEDAEPAEATTTEEEQPVAETEENKDEHGETKPEEAEELAVVATEEETKEAEEAAPADTATTEEEQTVAETEENKEEETNAEDAEETSEAPEAEAQEEENKDAEEVAPTAEAETEVEAKEENSDESAEGPKAEESQEGEEVTEEPAEEEEEEIIDYSTYNREELVQAVEDLSKTDEFGRAENILGQILPLFNRMEKDIREAAFNKFILDGGTEDDFEFRRDEVFNRFDAAVRLVRDRRASYIRQREANKEKNYEKKLALLDRLRELVDGPEASTNISPIKEIQQEWRSAGPVPNQHNRTLWANYNALLDRFYNNRHILFELKELDRKKNQKLKEELCEKAEALDKLDNIKDAIVQLNELHEEYKKVGPVPREVQESLWQRFKAASDQIYKKRKVYLESLKGELQENLEKKRALAEEVKTYISFDSDRINEWNAKTKEVIAIQKKWEALGGLPREHAKEVNRDFWSAFKTFFSHKNEFFKKLEGKRKENLEAKQKLVEEARALKDSVEWDKTSDKLKGLQRKWKDIGPVPEKFRNSVYADFKAACDEFFNNRRANMNKAEEGYVDNLKNKEALCDRIEGLAKKKEGSADDLDGFVTEWKEIGFVPKASIKTIDERFQKALQAFVNALDVPEEDREGLIMKAQLSGLAKGPNADRNIQKKEGAIRRQIQELEDNINLWNNNLAFFANSKTADKLKAEFDEKIEKAEEEIRKLKKQLRLVRSI